MDIHKKRIHFIGCNGASMKGLMRIVEVRGARVSGSDLALEGHSVKNVDEEVELVVFSGAIAGDNVELLEAKKRGITCIERGEFLGRLCKNFASVIAVAGTHGKTTTSAMLGCVMREATLHFGGSFSEQKTTNDGLRKSKRPRITYSSKKTAIRNEVCKELLRIDAADESIVCDRVEVDGVRLGGDTLITEACEFRRSMLYIEGAVAVITNIDFDHPDCYKNKDEYFEAFKKFADQSKAVIACGDDGALKHVKNGSVVTFGFGKWNDYRAVNVEEFNGGAEFDVMKTLRQESADTDYKKQALLTAAEYAFCDTDKTGDGADEVYLGRIRLAVIGRHNVLNALCSVATALNYGMEFKDIAERLEVFLGVKRRMELIGELGGREVWLDYAHHPKEIECALNTFNEKKIAVVFQPHTYSRLRSLWNEFGEVFDGQKNKIKTDKSGQCLTPQCPNLKRIVVLPVYAAREKAVNGVGGQEFAEHFGFYYADSFENAREYLDRECGNDEMVLLLGAGNVDKVIKF